MLTSAHPILTETEWVAVSIALRDAQRCGCDAEARDASSGGLRRMTNLLFGRRRPPPLASPRLEAIRRFVCASNRRRKLAVEHVTPLTEHGFNRAQIDALGLLSL
jgi:hypothetical protein